MACNAMVFIDQAASLVGKVVAVYRFL